MRDETTTVLIVAEAMHQSAEDAVQKLTGAVTDALEAIWSITPKTAILSGRFPRFEW